MCECRWVVGVGFSLQKIIQRVGGFNFFVRIIQASNLPESGFQKVGMPLLFFKIIS